DRALKAIPNGALLSRLQVVEGGPQKIGHRRSVEFPTKNQYDEGVEDARAHELIRVGILDDVVDRTRIAIENICHDPMAGFSGGVAKNELDIWPAKEPRQRAIRRLLPPLAKQMERDEQSVLFNLARRLVSIDGLQQQRRHHRRFGGRRPDRLGRQALAGTQLVKDLHRTVLPVHSNVASISRRSMIAEGTSVENCASGPKAHLAIRPRGSMGPLRRLIPRTKWGTLSIGPRVGIVFASRDTGSLADTLCKWPPERRPDILHVT